MHRLVRCTLLTSCTASSPAYAAVISLLNDYLLSKGKSPLGFMNPALYSNLYKGHNDITVGSSFGCGTDGFPATQGFDLGASVFRSVPSDSY